MSPALTTSPAKSPSPSATLRSAADEWANDFFDPAVARSERAAVKGRIAEYGVVAIFVVFLAAYEWLRSLTKAPYAPEWFTIFAVVITTYAAFRMWLMWPRLTVLDNAQLGWKGLTQSFTTLGQRGWFVFDSLSPASGLALAPVIVGPGGVFALSVRTNPLEGRRGEKLCSNEEAVLMLGDRRPPGAPVAQAQQATDQLRAWLDSIGLELPVSSLLAYPAWTIDNSAAALPDGGFLVNNESLAQKLFSLPEKVSPGELIALCEALSRCQAKR